MKQLACLMFFVCLTGVPSARADVVLTGVYMVRVDNPVRYRVTQDGARIRVATEQDTGLFKKGEVFFDGQLKPGAGASGTASGKYRLDGAWVSAELEFQTGTNYRNFTIKASDGSTLLGMVFTHDKADPPIDVIGFVDESGNVVDPVAGFSQPAPVVTLDPISRSAVTVSAGIARFTLQGSVRSDLAEIIANGAIKTVAVEYFTGSPRKRTTVTVPVSATPGTAPANRPFHYLGRFKASVSVPLRPGGTNVTVRARDVAGGEGFDSISIRAGVGGWTQKQVKGVEVAVPTSLQLEEVRESPSSLPGVFHPIWIRVSDPTSTPSRAPKVVTVGNRKIALVQRDGALFSKEPFIALAGKISASSTNVMSIKAPLVVKYGTVQQKLGWASTIHSPARIYSYAAGTEVTHQIAWSDYAAWNVTSVIPMRKEPRNVVDGVPRGYAWVKDPEVTVIETTYRDGVARVRLRLGRNSDAVRDKGLQFFMTSKADPSITRAPTIGDYSVVKLRTVIVGVDGLARAHALEGKTFTRVFQGAGAVQETALSALPTITWCNWAGIMTGRPPSQHGVLGNSFFARDQAARQDLFRRPFNSDTRVTFISLLQSLAAVVAGLDAQLFSNVNTIYDAIANAAPKLELDVYSVNMWYRRGAAPENSRVRIDDGSFSLDFSAHGHNPDAARLLDADSGDDAVDHYLSHADSNDILTVYLPGPDNIAHAIGDRDIRKLHAEDVKYTRYTSGPALPEVTKPLAAIGEHNGKVTDEQLSRIVDLIDAKGYLYATVFVLVADHGLHAYSNEPDRLIQARHERGLRALFTRLDLRIWTSGVKWLTSSFASADNYQVIYAPNGGLGHFYIRSGADGANWAQPARERDIARVARQLLIEATSGQNAGTPIPKCGDGEIGDRACFADLTKLGPLLPRQPNKDGALGSPPAIFVRMPNAGRKAPYRWLSGIDLTRHRPGQPVPSNGEDLVFRSVDDYVTTRGVDWPSFAKRLDEMSSARSGDIVIITNGREGYLTVNEGDEFDGWHGGPEVSESQVPLFFNIPDGVVDVGFLADAVGVVKGRGGANEPLRNWQMGAVLAEIYRKLYR